MIRKPRRAYTPADWYWVVGTDTRRVWSSAASAYVSADDAAYLAFAAKGRATRIPAEDDLTDVLGAHGLSGPLGNRWRVKKYTIVKRLEAAGLLLVADQALDGDRMMRLKWDAIDSIRADDPGALALLAAIGADPDVILAAET